jgi:hypothetical protein
MKHSSIWTIALAVMTALTTAAWAQDGGSAGGHGGGAGHNGPPSVAANGGSHSDSKANTRSGGAGNFAVRARLLGGRFARADSGSTCTGRVNIPCKP